MSDWMFHIIWWCLVGAAVLGYLGFWMQILSVGFVATGLVLLVFYALGG